MTKPSYLLAAAVSTVVLLGCGAGGSSPADTAAPSAQPAAAVPTAPTAQSQGEARRLRKLRRRAGRAAPFVLAGVDNSVPTFGREASAAERAAVEASLRTYLQARAREEWRRVCRALAGPVREGYRKLSEGTRPGKPRTCAANLAALSQGADLSDPLAGHLLSLRVKGTNSFALFYGPGHQRYMVPLLREGNIWRPTQSAPIRYPPGQAMGGG